MSKNFYLLLLIISFNSFGQNAKLDSLIRATESMKDDTAKVSKLSFLGNRLITDKADNASALNYFREAEKLSINLNYEKGILETSISTGIVLSNLSRQNEAIVYFKKAAKIFELNPRFENDKSLCFKYVKLFSDIGWAYTYTLDYANAQKNAFFSVELSNRFKTGYGYGYSILSDIFLKQNNYVEAQKYAFEALNSFSQTKLTAPLSKTYNTLGILAYRNGDYMKSIEYYELMFQVNKKANRVYGMRLSLFNTADAYFILKEYDKAIYYLNESEKFVNVIDAQSLSTTSLLYGEIYRQKKDYVEAVKYGKTGLNHALKSNNFVRTKSSYLNLYQTYKATNDSANALMMLEKLSQIKDSLYTSDMAKNTADLAKKYETEKKEQQIVFLDKENKLNQEKLAKEILLALALKHENELKASKLKQGSLLRNTLEKQNKLLDIEIFQKREIQKGLERENALKNSELSTETKLNQTLKSQNNLMAKNSKNETLARWFMMAALLGFTAFGINYYRNYTRQKSDNQQIVKQSEELKTLMREVHHRVKNNLQIISAMLRMQARSVADKSAIEALMNSENRLQTIAMVHEKLYKSENLNGVLLKDYLQELMEVLSKQHQNIVPKFHFDIQDNAHLTTNLDTAIPVGLIVNELVTNSFKYAFAALENGEINLLIGKGNNNDYQLDIRDNGPGFPDGVLPKSSKSLGLKLVNLFTEQLNGSMKYQTDKGSHFTFIFKPISLIS